MRGTAPEPVFFRDADEFDAWLAEHHATETELWMGLYKKHVADRGLTWEEAVPVALRWGWIDSVLYRIDEDRVRQRWTPRKASSVWSRVNVAHVERLLDQGRMQPAGLAAWERRRPERTGVYAFEQEVVALHAEAEARLRAEPRAAAFWDAATAGYRKQCATWVMGAKQQATRDRRLAQLIDCCARGELIPPQRYGAPPTWLSRAVAAAEAAR